MVLVAVKCHSRQEGKHSVLESSYSLWPVSLFESVNELLSVAGQFAQLSVITPFPHPSFSMLVLVYLHYNKAIRLLDSIWYPVLQPLASAVVT